MPEHVSETATAEVAVLTFLAGGGEMGERIRAFDWDATPLGPPSQWPQSLRSTISMLLPSKAQIILFWGPEFIVVYNDAYREVFGAKHPRMLGLPGRVAWSEIWDAQLHGLLAGVVRTGEAFWGKDLLFALERNGFAEETYFDVSYDPVRDESGDVGGVFCIVRETTDRVVGERRMGLLRELAANNATARTISDACRLAVQTLASGSRDIPFALIYIGSEFECGTPGAQEARAACPAELVKELVLPGSSGATPARLIVGINPMRPFDDAHRSFLGLVADQVGTAINNARAYDDARQRAEALAEIDRAKTAFFNNVSHEFRTPLTLLLGPVQDAIDNSGTLDRDALETVHRNSLRLLKLVNTLLDFARFEAGRADASYEPTDLAAYTVDLASAFRAAVEGAGLRFDVDCQPIGEPIHVDRAMWEKVVFNLLSNALKFTFDGGIRLSLTREGTSARLDISDTGTGIAADQVPHLFERFHRVRGARSRTHEGTGIGLAMVQELVRQHGGTIEVSSEPGRGTTFTVRIPLGTAHLDQAALSAPREASAATVTADAFVSEARGWTPGTHDVRPAAGHAGDARILLADDNADMRDYVARLLGNRWQVDAVADGASALAAAQEHRPTVIVADVMMPGLDGFGLLRSLRADSATADVPIILLSARAGQEATLEGIEAGADDYLVKPFSARELVTRVEAQVNRAKLLEAQARARHQLTEANRIKDEFLATLSHELRTPLNAIIGWTHVLRASKVRPDVLDRALQAIDRNARAQAQLVDDLLDVSRVISGKLSIRNEAVGVRSMIADAADSVRPALTAKDLKLRTAIDADADIVITADTDRLRQVLWNLLSNAVKFTPPGGSVSIHARRVPGRVEIRVRDTGVGIDREFLPHVFERFRQADAGASRRHGGLGLGLAIVRHLVEAHGGSIEAMSDGPGTGAEFVLTLPVSEARPRSSPAVERRRGVIEQSLAGRRVLVVDDEPDAREVTRLLIEQHGAAVTSAGSAAEAREILGAQPFDAMVADIGMPGEDGYSLMRSVRMLPEAGTIPAIALTAYATPRERDEAIDAGFSAHLGKPVDGDRLIATIAMLTEAPTPPPD